MKIKQLMFGVNGIFKDCYIVRDKLLCIGGGS